jgi:predicted nuclease with TOPRIM domain
MAQKGERLANKELVQITFDNDEIEEKFKYLEQKYHALIERMGASQEDIDLIDEKIIIKNESRA